MHVADASDCKKLYRLSGWRGQYWWYSLRVFSDGSETYELVGEHEAPFSSSTFSAYDADYLTMMLPGHVLEKRGSGDFYAMWQEHTPNGRKIVESSRSNAANALCRLAITLFEAGVLLHIAA